MVQLAATELNVEQKQALSKLLAILATLPGTNDIAGRITEFVLDGGDESVLTELQGVPVGWQIYHVDAIAPFEVFYRASNCGQAPALLRWARILTVFFNKAFVGNSRLPAGAAAPWLEALLYHQSGSSPSQFGPDRSGALSYTVLEALYRAEGLDPAELTMLPFTVPRQGNYGVDRFMMLLRQIPGFIRALLQQQELVRPHLIVDDLEKRQQYLSTLIPATGDELEPFLAELIASACVNRRELRMLAQSLVRRCSAHAVYAQALQQHTGAKPEARAYLLQLAMQSAVTLPEEALQAQLRTLASADKSEVVRVLVTQWDNELQIRSAAGARPSTDWANALNEGSRKALAQAHEQLNIAIAENNVRRRDNFAGRPEADQKKWPLFLLEAWSSEELKALCDAINNPDPNAISQCADLKSRAELIRAMLKALAINPEISLPALLKTVRWFFPIAHTNGALQSELTQVLDIRHAALGAPDLLTVGVALIDMGILPRRIIHATVSRWGGFGGQWPSAAVVPFYQAFIEEFAACFELETLSHSSINRDTLYRIFSELPEPRALVFNRIFEIACGSAKTERAPAQAALSGLAETPPRLIAALADGKADVRAQAAAWLARLRHEAALPALEKAVRAEKNDIAKGAMLDALQRFGRPIAAYIDRAALLKDAQKLLAKPLPAELHWLAWESLPSVRWADNDQIVEPDVLRFLIVNACKQKNPEPNAVLRKYCEAFEATDRTSLGEWLLNAWITADSKPPNYATADRQAKQHAVSMHAFYQNSAAADDPNRLRTVEQLQARYLALAAKQPVGTEIASKGVLAVAAACGSAAFAAPVSRYLKDFYGTRAAQCKALMAMLAWVEHPSAIQLVLAIGKRFRTKGIQEEAAKQAQQLAERNDWTLDELADRTIPTGGLDDEGVLDLSYGEREFSAVLKIDAKAGLKLELRNPDGKSIAALPEPRADDNAELAATAKKNLTLAKKEIKTVIDLQTPRLYDAMCTGRFWRFDDFDRYLNRHPVVRHLVQRLIWSTADGVCFRPMADATLTDLDDAPIHIDADMQIRIAHDLWMTDAAVQAWQAHCADYQVKPLFQQFGKGRYQPSDGRAQGLFEANGVLMDAFNLRTRAGKLGYMRGPINDGPSFDTYVKHFPTLNLRVDLEFSGSAMPEVNVKIALLALRFLRVTSGSDQVQILPLSEVPAVLLAECHFDLKTLAAEGVVAPDWQAKVGR